VYPIRHSWATRALQRSLDPLTVAILVGHSEPSMLATDRCAMKVTTASHLVLDFQQNLCKEGNLHCAAVSKVYQHVAHDPEYTRAAAERATGSGA